MATLKHNVLTCAITYDAVYNYRICPALLAPRQVELFQRLRGFLVAGTAGQAYAGAGAELEMSGDAMKKAVHRMRHRYYELFREEIAHTVAEPAEVEEEMRYLCAVMAG